MSRMTRRILLAAVSAVAVVGAAAAQAKTKITYWAWTEHVAAANAVKTEFEKQNPDIEVEISNLNPFDLQDKFLVAMAAGVGGPDVALILQRRFDVYISTGGLLETTKEMSPLKGQYPAAVWSSIERDGKTYGVPYDQNPSALFYRSDIFEQNNIKVPFDTWDDFVAAGKVLSQKGIFITHVSAPSGVPGVANLVEYLQSRNAQIFDDNGKVVRNNALARETVRFYYDLARTHKIAFESRNNAPEFFQAIKDGRIAGYAVPSWALFRLQKEAPEQSGKWRAMPWPKWGANAPATTGAWGGNVLAIPKSSKNKEAALKWAQFIGANDITQIRIWEEGHLLPAFEPALKSEALLKGESYLGGQSIYESALKPRTLNNFNYFDWAKTEVIVGNELDLMFGNKKTPEQAWDDIEKQLISQLRR
ncbi:ABC transporter substrate-binding protein [Microvirga pudoricolor]|uniref:ABC transporter substrate-binding protein n=1 Tax=Microvirga pudoricolor TaxID=2778729 RepID=UPI00195181BE|nr:sugar ABC transporter substrate-binding protein [Microvirga pudoricolor]MBM6593593.1 sugar ABC transporter substrate-binding protein [Microvirga pudoricolor]